MQPTKLTAGQLEVDLLLLLSKPKWDETDCQRIEAQLGDDTVNWELMAEIAGRQGLVSTAWQNLNSRFPARLSQQNLAPMRYHAAYLTRMKVHLLRTYLGFDKLLKSSSIDYISFKGPAWTALAYNGDMFARDFGDIDLFMKKADLKKLCDILMQDGFRLAHKPKGMPMELALSWSHGVNLKKGPMDIDLHYQLQSLSYLPITNSAIWDSAVDLEILGTKVNALSDELQVITHCAHATKGLWKRAIWPCDLAHLLVSRPAFDWAKVYSLARSLQIDRMVTVGLLLANRLMQSELPPEADSSDPELRELVDVLAQFHTPASDRQQCLYRARLSNSWAGKIAPTLEMIFQPKPEDWERFPLPKQLGALYYILHPCRKIYRYTANAARRMGIFK